MRLRAILLSLAVILALPMAATAQDIDTAEDWNGTDFISSFGKSNTATYGQTFTVGTETYLDSFEFWLRYGAGGTDLLFSAYIGEWNGSRLTSLLWSSDEGAPYTGPATSSFQHYSFSTGSLGLNAGGTYVAFLSASNHFDEISSTSAVAYMGRATGDSYSGGHFVYLNNGSEFDLLSTQNWSQWTTTDAAFRADFSATGSEVVPEPITFVLLGSGLLGIGLVGVRRRRDADGLLEA